jgi:transposase
MRRAPSLSGYRDPACGVRGLRRELGGATVLIAEPEIYAAFCVGCGQFTALGLDPRVCRAMSIRDVAKRMNLDWRTIKELDKLYMREQLRVAGHPAPRAIGVDEISIRKGHTYRIVVSDLDKGRAIWFGGEGRTQKDMDRFFAFLGPENSQNIKVAVMDMWKPFRTSTQTHAPQAAVVFDKFHILRHLSDALDVVRRSEYKRVAGDERRFIKGQRYVLLSKRENLSADGRKNLESLLQANRRLNIAYILREQFEQLWDYTDSEQARAFFDNWCNGLSEQDLPSYKKFAAMVKRHWDGIAAYCHPDNKVPLGPRVKPEGKLCRRSQQQDPGLAAPRLRFAR